MNATSRVQEYLDESAAKLRAWQDNHLSVPFSEVSRATVSAPPAVRHVASFPPAPREYRGLILRRAGRGVRP